MENNKMSIDSLKELKRIRTDEPKYEATLIYNGSKIDCWIYTRATVKIKLINSRTLSVYDHTCRFPKNFDLDVETKFYYMNNYNGKIKKELLDIIKGNGHI